MKTYSVQVRWNHKGSKYPKSETHRIEGTSASAAAGKALRLTKKANPKSFREPGGATIRIDILVVNGGTKGGDDGRGRLLQHQEEPESGS